MKRIVALAILLCASAALGEDSDSWPTLHRDYQRSGFTGETIQGPFQRKWFRDFHDEVIATRCEPIVAEGKVFVGTFAGKLHALDIADGKTAWTFLAAGPIGASPCYCDGTIFVGSDDAFHRGTLYCLDAATGALVWRYATPAGIWSSPAAYGARVFVGDRSGVFHAVDAKSGNRAWTFKTGSMILKPASFSEDGQRIVLGSEDMHVYCLTPDGTLLWKSRKLPGLSLRDQGPTIWQGLAIVRTNPADGFHEVMNRNGHLLKSVQQALPIAGDDKVLLDKWNDLLLSPRPERRRAELEGIVKYLRENRHDQTFHALDLRDGSEPWIAPVFYTCGLHNPATPPTFNRRTGELYTLYRTALTHYVRGVRRYSGLGRIDRRTGLIDWSWPDRDEPRWQDFPMIPDETQSLSLLGSQILGTHQGILTLLNPANGAATPVQPFRDTYAGIFGPGAVPGGFDGARKLGSQGYLTEMPNEWHGPDRAICAVAGGRIFWMAGSQIVCIAGPKVPAAPSGGDRPPPLAKRRVGAKIGGGNVVSGAPDRVDAAVEKRAITAAELEPLLKAPPRTANQAAGPLADSIRARLVAEVEELIAGAGEEGWAPLVVELGISGEERHFWRTAETIQILSLALPHLPTETAEKVKRHLNKMVQAGCPLASPVHDAKGRRREPFELGPGMKQFAEKTPQYEATIEDLYAVWAFAHYADACSAIDLQAEAIARMVDQEIRRGVDFRVDAESDNDAAEHLNARIAGMLAAVRIFRQRGDQPAADRALDHLARLVTERVHHEKADGRLIRPTKVASHGLHQAKVPRYVALAPEVGQMLRQHAGEATREHCDTLRTGLPVWYQAWGERMIGGENYISPPHLARAVFLAWADAADASPEDLAAKLDQPWGEADLYYIEKLSAVLRAGAN